MIYGIKAKQKGVSQNNLTKNEFEALDCLQNKNDIIIKKPDKGSTVIIADVIDYINEAIRQLNNMDFYKKNPQIQPTHTSKKSKTLLMN